ncbi:A disintegrin and metalloproteinase with thrombospondin motifs 15-like [Trichogramma pretiosum]|uniref:A disintegrin and metalloproteinase with thrombospondin motifs 15-like n=1 Tax=Trichogramma pretiosum TaxID=7493 RepID=UPI0006C9BB7A|nr:A disintegrin and metalloproteinase with thrombospondin motifs 15-like [Trichogramma pretiosum]
MVPLYLWSTLVIAAFGNALEIHNRMTADEVRSTFSTANHDEIPEYDVVPVSHAVHERSPEGGGDHEYRILQIRALSRDIKLYLEPSKGILASNNTPIWFVKGGDRSSPLGLRYRRIRNAFQDMDRYYQDPNNLAALKTSYDDDGQMLFEGTIGDDLVIRPLPARLRGEISRSRRSVVAVTTQLPQSNRTVIHPALRRTHYHVVFKKKTPRLGRARDETKRKKSSRSKRDAKRKKPKIAYPQVLVVLDYDEQASLQPIDELKSYILSYWNAVDLRFRVFSDPEIRLNLAGVVVAKNPTGVPYIQKHRVGSRTSPNFDADEALDDMARYYYRELMDDGLHRFVLDRDFDLVVVMTSLNLCHRDPFGGTLDCEAAGYAYRGGACSVSLKDKMVRAVGMVEDNGGYVGIVPTAHEVGHLLGIPHDGHEQPDKTFCPEAEGYIMTGMMLLTNNIFKWSQCSMEHFQDFFDSPRSECVFDRPAGVALPRVLPGKILSLDEQCDRISGTYACEKNESVCVHLECYTDDGCSSLAPAAEGSPCGANHHCINGKCVDKQAKKIDLDFAPPPSPDEHVDVALLPRFAVERS